MEKKQDSRKSTEGENELIIKQLRRSLIVSGVFQIPYLLLLFVFYNLSLYTTMDILYFPPFLDFTLKNYSLWNVLFVVLSVLLILQFALGIILRVSGKLEKIAKMMRVFFFISCTQLVYLPIGTYYGLYEFQIMKKLLKSISKSIPGGEEIKNSESIDPVDLNVANVEEIQRKIGKVLIGVGAHWLGWLLFLILLTFYFTTVMLDMTFPYLTMSILLTARSLLGIMVGISIAEVLFGQIYYRIKESKGKTILYWIFWLWSFILIPVGTSGALLMRKMQKPE